MRKKIITYGGQEKDNKGPILRYNFGIRVKEQRADAQTLRQERQLPEE
jgi:hypothetical protein